MRKIKTAYEPVRRWLRKARILAIATAFVPVLLYLSGFFEDLLIDHTSMGRASATWVIAIIAVPASMLCSYIIWRLVKTDYVQRTVLEDALPPSITDILRNLAFQCVLMFIVIAALFYFTFPNTHLGRLGCLWWSGPALELAATSPEKTFQSTINLPWFKYGQDFGVVKGWRWQGISQNRDTIETAFARLHQTGVKGVVWFLFSDGRGAPTFDADGYVISLDQDFWHDYDTAIEMAHKYEISIVWVLLDFQWLASGKQENGAALFGHADTIKDRYKRESFFQKALIPILRRHPLEPQIAGWIVINEPENALKNGNIGSELLAEFVQRTSELIRKYTYRQPVSIGSADLESLIEYWGKNAKVFDFFVFHHYEKFLPPPADYVRSLMTDAHDKPIYIGEFKIDDPPIPLNEWVNWVDSLGYAGLWGWKLNEDETVPHYGEAKQISDLIAAHHSDGSDLRGEFSQRHQVPASSRSTQLTQNIGWWERHGAQTVLPGVSANIAQWERNLSELETQLERFKIDRLTNEQELQVAIPRCFAMNNAQLQSHTNEADRLNLQIDDYESQLEKARANSDRAWANRVLVWLAETKRKLRDEMEAILMSDRGITVCEEWRRRVKLSLQDIDAQMRDLLRRPGHAVPNEIQVEDAADAIANWYRYRIRWSQKLYQDFWKIELKGNR